MTVRTTHLDQIRIMPEHYRVDNPTAGGPTDRTVVEELGGRIRPIYEQGGMTPTQKNRIIAITVLVAAIVGAVGFLVATCMISLPFLAGAIPLLLLGGGAAIYLGLQKPDLDDPKIRSRIQTELRDASFATIATKHPIGQIIGYRLLDKIGPNMQEGEISQVAYSQLKRLYDSYHRITRQLHEDLAHTDRAFSYDTATARAEKENQLNRLQNEAVARRLTTITARQMTPAAAPALQAINLMGDMSNQHTANHIQDHYRRRIAPAVVRKSTIEQEIRTTARRAFQVIENYYHALKTYLEQIADARDYALATAPDFD